jgi:hypothetical protein
MTEQIFRSIYQKGYTVFVDNSKSRSFNINIDRPSFFCFAISEAEAIGKMIQSNFNYKYLPIVKIDTL